MTMEMAVTCDNFFRASYPYFEAYSDSFVSDEDIQKLKDLPMWFIHAANDTTVNPANFVIPTYQRLALAGTKELHFSYFTDVVVQTVILKVITIKATIHGFTFSVMKLLYTKLTHKTSLFRQLKKSKMRQAILSTCCTGWKQ